MALDLRLETVIWDVTVNFEADQLVERSIWWVENEPLGEILVEVFQVHPSSTWQ